MAMDHTAIRVSNLEDSLAFYRDVFGYEPLDEYEESDVVSDTFVGVDGQPVFQFVEGDESVDPGDVDHFGVSVPDVDEAVSGLDDDRIHRGPETLDELGLRIAFVEDPDGYVLELLASV